MKLREFWVRENKSYPEDSGPKYYCSTAAPRPPGTAIHVREVSSQLDAAYEECEKALEDDLLSYRSSYRCGCCEDAICQKHSALAALRKARE